MMDSSLELYVPPDWAKILNNIPTHKIQLGHLNTPIHRWKLPDIPDDFNISIKRDDMTGCSLSGNKVRKLEFILADALASGCKHVITTGDTQSNHCRDTAIAAAQIGIKCHLVIKSHSQDVSVISTAGNAFLYRLVGSSIFLMPVTSTADEVDWQMKEISDRLKQEKGEESHIIPRGGSDEIGIFGYIDGFKEMMDQGILDKYDDVVVACGSGSTLEGIALSNHLTGRRLRIHGIAVNNDKPYFHRHVEEVMANLGVEGTRPCDLFDVTDEYMGQGYGYATHEIQDYIIQVARTTGVILDLTYTGKAVMGLVQEIRNNPARFQGRRILYVHTGGIFGVFDGRMDSTLRVWDKK